MPLCFEIEKNGEGYNQPHFTLVHFWTLGHAGADWTPVYLFVRWKGDFRAAQDGGQRGEREREGPNPDGGATEVRPNHPLPTQLTDRGRQRVGKHPPLRHGQVRRLIPLLLQPSEARITQLLIKGRN